MPSTRLHSGNSSPTLHYSLHRSYSKIWTRALSNRWANSKLFFAGEASATGWTSRLWTPPLHPMCWVMKWHSSWGSWSPAWCSKRQQGRKLRLRIHLQLWIQLQQHPQQTNSNLKSLGHHCLIISMGKSTWRHLWQSNLLKLNLQKCSTD